MRMCDLIAQCVLKVEYVPYLPVTSSGLEFDSIRQNEIRLLLGETSIEDEFGYEWTKKDLPLIELHERGHLELMKKDNSIACFKAFCEMGREGRIRQIKEEIAAWKIGLAGKVETPFTLSKVQDMINTYVWNHMKREEIYQ